MDTRAAVGLRRSIRLPCPIADSGPVATPKKSNAGRKDDADVNRPFHAVALLGWAGQWTEHDRKNASQRHPRRERHELPPTGLYGVRPVVLGFLQMRSRLTEPLEHPRKFDRGGICPFTGAKLRVVIRLIALRSVAPSRMVSDFKRHVLFQSIKHRSTALNLIKHSIFLALVEMSLPERALQPIRF